MEYSSSTERGINLGVEVKKMVRRIALGLLSVFVLTVAAMAAKEVSPVLNFKMKNILGEEVFLADYQGSVLLLVNVASKCGLTPQYEGLQKLHETYKDKGFKILAFPANNFGAQEPGTEAEIREFCSTKYKVTFDMFSKVSVKGEDMCDLYKFLTDPATNGEFAGEIQWNFQKYLIDKKGKVVAKFEPKTKPEDPKLIAAIEKALGE
ncbi:MAG: Hydroperoxy fatty acid reductase gpx1 [bacterium]|nr:Hydroperoxy fatty acid reductase gpx1 [bacterium]